MVLAGGWRQEKSEVPKPRIVRRVNKTTNFNEELRARKVTNETQDSHARAPSRPPVTMVDIGCSQSKDMPATAIISASGKPQPSSSWVFCHDISATKCLRAPKEHQIAKWIPRQLPPPFKN
jgi:cytochrome c5